jgi:hypothetical protein
VQNFGEMSSLACSKPKSTGMISKVSFPVPPLLPFEQDIAKTKIMTKRRIRATPCKRQRTSIYESAPKMKQQTTPPIFHESKISLPLLFYGGTIEEAVIGLLYGQRENVIPRGVRQVLSPPESFKEPLSPLLVPLSVGLMVAPKLALSL